MSGGLRIVHLTHPGRAGGLETVVAELSSALRAAGHQAEVVTVLPPDEVADHPFVSALHARDIPVHVLAIGGRAYLRERAEIVKRLSASPLHALHTHGFRADVVDGSLARSLRCARVTTLHGFVGNSRRGRLYEWLQVRAARQAHAAIAVSEPIRQRLLSAGCDAARVHLIRNARAAVPLVTRDEARQRLGLPATQQLVGWVGRLSSEKAPDLFLQALAELSPDVHGVLMGDGPMRTSLQERASQADLAGRVTFAGLVPDAAQWLTALDALALTSRTEGTPMILLEAMQAGVPIVASAVGGVPDLLSPHDALLTPPGNAAETAAALRRILSDRPLATILAEHASATARDRFGVEQWAARHATLYAELHARLSVGLRTGP